MNSKTKKAVPDKTITFEMVEDCQISTTDLGRITGLNRNTIRKYLEGELEPVTKTGNMTSYRLGEAIEAICSKMGEESSSDIRNRAQARLATITGDNLLRKNIPIEEIAEPFSDVMNMINTVFQESGIEDEKKELIAERIETEMAKLRQKYGEAIGLES